VATQGFDDVADWYNPHPQEHAGQVAFIKAYVKLLRDLAL
jgi:hypothetical protein